MRSARGKEAVVLRQPEKRNVLDSNVRRMANKGRSNSRPWEARWLELLQEIDELKETEEKLRRDVEEKCETAQLIKDQGDALRLEIKRVDRELHERQRAKVLNHAGNNEHWINVRAKLCETYSKAREYLEDAFPEEDSPRLPAFNPQKLTVTKQKVPRKQNEENPEETGKEEESKKEQAESVYNSVVSKRTELPADVVELTEFLERKQLLFQKKITEIDEAKNRLTRVAHVKILQRWLDQVFKYEDSVHKIVGVEPVVGEMAVLLETWENLETIVKEAEVLLQPYISTPPDGQDKKGGERVLDWLDKSGNHGEDAGKDKGGNHGEDAGKDKSGNHEDDARKDKSGNHGKRAEDDAGKEKEERPSRRDYLSRRKDKTESSESSDSSSDEDSSSHSRERSLSKLRQAKKGKSPKKLQQQELPQPPATPQQPSGGEGTLASKSIADDALKGVPQFSGDMEQFLDWEQVAQTFIDTKFYKDTVTFQLLKKTLEGRPRKLVDVMSLQEPELLKKMMKKLKKEYGDAGKLAVEQRRKITSHPVVNFGADNLQDFFDLVERTYQILKKAGKLGDETEFVATVLSRLPRAYQNRVDDSMKNKSRVS